MNGSARDAACLPFGMVGELRPQLDPVALAVLLLFMGVGMMDIRVSAEFPCLRQRAAFSFGFWLSSAPLPFCGERGTRLLLCAVREVSGACHRRAARCAVAAHGRG